MNEVNLSKSIRETVEVTFVNGQLYFPFSDTYENFKKGERNNPEYGYIYVKSYNYQDELDTIAHDSIHPERDCKVYSVALYGKLSDLQLLLHTNSSNVRIPGKIVGGKYVGKIPHRFINRIKNKEMEYYCVRDIKGHKLWLEGEPIYRLAEYVLTETLYTDNVVKVIKNSQGEFINLYRNSNFGYIDVSDEVFQVDNGHLEVKTRFAQIKGAVKLLEQLLKSTTVNDQLPGRIIVKEFVESEVPMKYDERYKGGEYKSYEDKISPYIKREGEGIGLLSKYSEKILSFPEYIMADSTEKDTLVRHQFLPELEDWRNEKYFTYKQYPDYEERWEYENSDEYRNQISHTEWLKEIEGDAFDNDPMNYWNIY
ncbi:hypothetical protein GCM10027443_18130 [Pontibacter brevis]